MTFFFFAIGIMCIFAVKEILLKISWQILMHMKQAIKIIFIGVSALLLVACSSGQNNGNRTERLSKLGDIQVAAISEMNELGSMKECSDGELLVADLSKLGAPKAILLSDLADDLRIVKLDDAEEALVKSGSVWFSGKRFVIYDGNTVKQFDKNGKYIGTVGAKGNGPGEYTIAPYDIAIDEERGRIYILAYCADKLLSYDLEGKFTGNVPLAHKAEKGFINVEPDGTLTIGALTFMDNEDRYAVWHQDINGVMTDGIKAHHLAVEPDYSNEVYKGQGENGFTYSLFRIDAESDTLYEYTGGKLRPAFTAEFSDKVRMHNYLSFPDFYLINIIGEPIQVSDNSFVLPSETPVLIDKRTHKGGAVELVLDFIGPIKTSKSWIFVKNPNYFMLNLDPGDLADALQKTINEESGIDETYLTSMKELLDNISPDDNNYLIVGKWKKSLPRH